MIVSSKLMLSVSDVVVVVVVVVVALAGDGVGAATPGVSTCPASPEIDSVRPRIVAALIRRKVFTFKVPPERVAKNLHLQTRPASQDLQERTD
jgi:hypothetical protein